MHNTIKEENQVSPSFLFFLVHSTQIGVGILGFQRYIIKGAGYEAWISIFLAATNGFDKSMILDHADIGYLLLLGTICTSLAYVAGVSVMRELSAFRVALITNLEPVYGIVMSFLFFGDMNKMTIGFWVGAIIILSTIFLFPVAQKQVARRRNG